MNNNNNTKKRVAYLGGSFDPPTIAHIQVACEIYNKIDNIDEVWISPCGDGRIDKLLKTPFKHRLNMLKLIKDDILNDNIPIIISEYEGNMQWLPTLLLIRELNKKFPDKEFVFVIGSDLYEKLQTWKPDPLKLVEEVEFLIICRNEFPFVYNKPGVLYPKKFQLLELNIYGSSTEIRERIKNGNKNKLNYSINALTSKKVINYIFENKLYNIK
jgi:nicotinate-nucleotide adenylyltransferase